MGRQNTDWILLGSKENTRLKRPKPEKVKFNHKSWTMIKVDWPKAVPATIRSSTGPSRVCIWGWGNGVEVEPINLEKKPPAVVGCRWAGARLIATAAAEDDEEVDTREVSDGLWARLLGRDGDDEDLTVSTGTGESVWGRPSGKTVL